MGGCNENIWKTNSLIVNQDVIRSQIPAHFFQQWNHVRTCKSVMWCVAPCIQLGSKASITAPDWLKTRHNWTQLTTTDPDSPVGFSRKHDHSAAGDVIRLTIPSDWTQLKMPTDQRVFRQSQNSENFRTGWAQSGAVIRAKTANIQSWPSFKKWTNRRSQQI